MPKIFGILLVIAGAGYLVDGFGAVLVQDYAISIGAFTFVGEVALIFWLLISGRRSDFHRADSHRHPRARAGPHRSPPRWDDPPIRRPRRHQETPMTPRLTAALLITAAVLTNAAFTVLGTVFNYPDILAEPVDDILTAFRPTRARSSPGSR